MRVLLDTDILLRTLAGDPLVEKNIGDVLLAEDTEVYVSVISWWDIAARIASGSLQADLDELREASVQSGFYELPLHGGHVRTLAGLPSCELHITSFDRMLAAQAETEPLRLISANRKLAGYTSMLVRI
ncbi:MAG: type II toxin-antitoxin system VapC family toxin [Prevotellaceae bacterium]|jgi:PIN domain nuclease of toxin-antitoxin system|nr:type II toxin-antitoxin system VapC family toxin [Prevotellaceae bacterium]